MGIDVGKFLKSPEYEIKITTFRDIFQVEALECDRLGEEYRKLSACLIMSKNDLNKMGLKAGDKVRVYNNWGSIVVEVKETKRDEPGGIAFMVNSPWSNALVSGDAGGKGIPEFKNITAKVSLVKEEVTTLENLIGIFRK
ncbi:MAG: molybdopterin dinucleotide binding domain-containing protein [Candidatus Methanoperedens sp.]|nr:formylmethanofuran dehydrogenase [Candidatus Methanoperedens sp.]MCZ7395838.1 formylmethanofuran dehydrogenase [Candidatus Methanoperedens sp.]